MDVRSKVYTYRSSLTWTERKIGTLSSSGKPDLQIATPPEFKGHEGIWSPEDLFVASVNVCVMSTFLAFAERAGVAFTRYESGAEGRVELVEGKLQVTSIVLTPHVAVTALADVDKAKDLLSKAEVNCLVSNSVKTQVTLQPTVEFEPL